MIVPFTRFRRYSSSEHGLPRIINYLHSSMRHKLSVSSSIMLIYRCHKEIAPMFQVFHNDNSSQTWVGDACDERSYNERLCCVTAIALSEPDGKYAIAYIGKNDSSQLLLFNTSDLESGPLKSIKFPLKDHEISKHFLAVDSELNVILVKANHSSSYG